MNRCFRCFISLISLMFCFAATAEVAVVVHPSNPASLSIQDISRIYLGKIKSFPGGSKAIALDQKQGSLERMAFVKHVLNKSESQLKSYWSKRLFSGQGQPPIAVDTNADVMELISANPNMIGFVDAQAVNNSVKVVATF
ncbi:phosphate ABC transporter substrate-binding protein, PhoT family [Shewanella psychrophila]|uniref:Phosphate ABC transporter substrate-binding protein, PhoT family n=1 Tax=Shewanella psychrophila TaxID=225848 RepID=A0A1S6HJY6_9GAMM|nr:substrate-binding domain-containing protein [Shewanella psychrophila]AQS35845.1 phosphate ABC transporter substrate-binding protein, PhoT family [Shewanella psychrophila]